jgi:hypothetical protein
VEILELLWDGGNRPHIRAHGINPEKVEELIDLDDWVVMRHSRYPEQVQVVDPTKGGRWLTIAMEPMQRPTLWRPVTGWDSAGEEIEYWREQHPL